MSKIQEHLQARKKALEAGRAILDKATEEKRETLTAEEQTTYDKLWDEAAELRSKVDLLEREERQAAADRELEDLEERGGRGLDDDDGDGDGDDGDLETRGSPHASKEYRAAFGSWLGRGFAGIPEAEQRALSVGSDVEGGFTVAPLQMVQRLLKDVDDRVYIRDWATNFQIPKAQSLGAPRLETDPSDAEWTSEIATGSEDSAMGFGKRILSPHPLAKRLKVSNNFLRQSALNGEQLVRDRLAYKFGVAFEKAGMTGSGASEPLGIFTASSDGISTSRDEATDNTTTAMTVDGLINAKYKLKPAYWRAARWLFHRDGQKQIAKLKDSNNQYLWRESVRAGEPDRLLNVPTFMSEFAPNTFTAGLYVGIIGDFSHYWIADALDMVIQRLTELYAEANQTGFIGRLESDGMPVTEEAFVRVTLAAS